MIMEKKLDYESIDNVTNAIRSNEQALAYTNMWAGGDTAKINRLTLRIEELRRTLDKLTGRK